MKTVNIEDELHKRLKIEAAHSDKKVNEIVAEALKEYLTRGKSKV